MTELTFEEFCDDHNLELVCSLWAEWVTVICERDKIARPTQAEWHVLRSNFYIDKAPIASVAELKQLRAIEAAHDIKENT